MMMMMIIVIMIMIGGLLQVEGRGARGGAHHSCNEKAGVTFKQDSRGRVKQAF
jgi:hypothetical protein